MNRRTIGLGGIALLGLGLGAIGAAASGALQSSDGPFTAESGPQPPAVNRWVRGDGKFVVDAYDDRRLTDEEKALNPVYDPRWKPFSHCINAAGFVSGVSSTTPFSQTDMAQLVRRVNDERPDAAANKSIGPGTKVPGLAGAFLECADRWLTIERADYEKNGIKDLAPGEIPAP